jgi:primosomal protein N' (replication factor Y)
VGVLVSLHSHSTIEPAKLRRAIRILDQQPLFPTALLDTLRWAADYYQHPPGEVFGTALPILLRTERQPVSVPGWRIRQELPQTALMELDRTPRQKEVWQLLARTGPMSQTECQVAGFRPALLRQMAQRELIEKIQLTPPDSCPQVEERRHTSPPLPANEEQAAAVNAVIQHLHGFSTFLLDGITGSGKTEVYLQIIAEVLARGRQALVLVPEIGLTPQAIQRFGQRFDCRVVGLHSAMTDRERLHAWELARRGHAGVVIGTRSAVFTPLARPGVIIIDEEHDLSFKQQDGFRYSARDLGIIRARQESIPIVLGSATPALETLYNAMSGKFTHLRLDSRAGHSQLPAISLLDTSTEPLTEGFAPHLLSRMESHLQSGNQVLVFINRRGFAPTLYCRDCGWIFECGHCDAQLTVHKSPPHLCCHHCESRQPLPAVCPNCQGKRLATRGMGTEKTEEFLAARFAPIPVVRMDRDSVRRRQGLHDVLETVGNGAPCLLVGTQMLAKGHHFPGVTLVVVLDADTGLFSADFRGQEQMVQLLTQVAGRAGRERQAGQVIIQTRHGSHPLLQTLLKSDYHLLAAQLMAERKAGLMPPFAHLAMFRAEAGDTRSPILMLNTVRGFLEAGPTASAGAVVQLQGPMPAPMERRAGRFRTQLLVKSTDRQSLQRLLTAVIPQIEQLKLHRNLRWSIDVDPVDLI